MITDFDKKGLAAPLIMCYSMITVMFNKVSISPIIGIIGTMVVQKTHGFLLTMAPSAANTTIAHFYDTKTTPADYDAIFTGDLGKLGENIFRDLMANANYPLDATYSDCGRMIYDHKQNQYQGGSGCGCGASVLNGYILNKLRKGELKKILFIATGALLSPVSSFQGNTIPAIAHAVVIEA